jgi:cytochrome c-type biogenesis protein CcmH
MRYFYRNGQVISRLSILAALGLCIVALTAFAGAARAQSPVEGVTANEVNEVAREIWCPLCSGVRLDSCELTACAQMKEEIALMLAEGQDTESIKAYFLEQYGPEVLGEPPREGFNWLAWILPFAALVVGGVFLWTRLSHMIRPAGQSSESVGDAHAGAPDTYEQKLDEELQQYR